MTTLIVDTDVVSFLLKGDTRAQLYRPHYQYVIVPFDNELCKQWASISVQRQRMGRPMSVQDAWIAATALRHSCPLVTHNSDDFSDITDLEVITEA